MNKKLLKQVVLFSTLLSTLSTFAGNIYVTNKEDSEVKITIRPDNGGSLDPKDHLEVVVQPGEETKIYVDNNKFGKYFHVKGQVGTVMLEHDKLPTQYDYNALYSKSENGGAIDVFTKLEKNRSKNKKR